VLDEHEEIEWHIGGRRSIETAQAAIEISNALAKL
jgi:hypothetical protein